MKQALQLKLGQSLSMTPQMQQAIRMLQLSTLELRAEIQQAIEINPFLEIDEHSQAESQDADPSQELTYDQPSDGSEEYEQRLFENADWQSASTNRTSKTATTLDDNWLENKTGQEESLQDHLLFQLEMGRFTAKDMIIGTTLIESIDSRGFLTSDIESLLHTSQSQWDDIKDHYETPNFTELNTDIEEWHHISIDEILIMLTRIQHFDPAGVGARDITECLVLQLQALAPTTPGRTDALCLLQQHNEALASQNIKILLKKSGLNLAQIQTALALLRTLETAPGERCCPTQTEYVVPDVIAYKRNGEWQVSLNPEVAPSIKLNPSYSHVQPKQLKKDEQDFFKTNMQDAKWFLKSLQSRHDTLLKIAKDIVACQIDFFEEGELAMKPMILADVAGRVEMHESTVSRVTTQKYIHTPRGVFELKYFFSSHVSTDDGGECSSTAIRAKIKQLIAQESAAKPLSDSKIAHLLEISGINIARRTVAKYRELDKIPSSSQRKKTF